MTAFKNWKYQS